MVTVAVEEAMETVAAGEDMGAAVTVAAEEAMETAAEEGEDTLVGEEDMAVEEGEEVVTMITVGVEGAATTMAAVVVVSLSSPYNIIGPS